MADSTTFSRIYELKTLGLDKSIADTKALIAQFELLGEAKAKVANTGLGGDAAQVQQFNQQIDALIASVGRNVVATDASVAANNALVAGLGQLAQAQQTVTTAVSQGSAAMGQNVSQTSAAAANMQTTVTAVTSATIDYDAAINGLAQKLAYMRGEFAAVNEQIKVVEEKFQKNAIDATVYADTIAELTVVQSQFRTGISEVTAAMTAMNKVYQPGLIDDETAALALNRRELQERNALLRQQAANELAPAGSIAKARAESALYRSELVKLNLTTEEGIARQKELLALTAERDAFIKNNVDAYTRQKINIGNYPEASGQLTAINAELAALRESGGEASAEFTALSAKAQELTRAMGGLSGELSLITKQMQELALAGATASAEYHALAARALELKAAQNAVNQSINAGQRSMQGYGQRILTFIERDLLRAVAGFVVFTALFEGVTKLWDAVANSEENAAKKADQLRTANEALAKSFEELSQHITAYKELQIGLNETLDESTEGLKRRAAIIKALGIEQGEVYKAEHQQLEANSEVRQSELNALQRKLEVHQKILGVLQNTNTITNQGTGQADAKILVDSTIDAMRKSGATSEMIKKFQDDISKAANSAGDADAKQVAIYKVLSQTILNYKEAILKTNQEIENNVNAGSVARIAEIARLQTLEYTKGLELNQQLKQAHEQFRQVKESGDIASVDKIVKDTNAKYTAMIDSIRLKMGELEKQFPNHKLPEGLQSKLDNILATVTSENIAAVKKGTEDYYKAASMLALQHNTQELQTNAALLANNANQGSGTYEDLSKSLDAQTKAKKQAIETEYAALKESYIKNGDDITNIQNQKDEKIIQVDKEAYKARLDLASQFFQKMTQNVNEGYDILLKDMDTAQAESMTKILNNHGVFSNVDEKSFRQQQKDAIAQAKLEIEKANQSLPGASDVVAKDKKAVDNAADYNEYDAAVKQLNKDLAIEAELKNKIAHANETIAQSQKALDDKDRERVKKVAEGFIDIANTVATGYQNLLAQQDAHREQQQQKAMDWNKKVRDSEAQSMAEKKRNDRADFVAQEELEKEKANNAKKRAQSLLVINFAVSSAKNFAEHEFYDALINEAILVAEFAAQSALLNSAPAYAKGKDPLTHLAWVGDGGEHELVKVGNQFSVTPNTPTLVNMPNNASVTPFSQIANLGGNMGANLKAPNFNVSSTAQQSGGGGNAQAFAEIHSSLRTIAGGMANMKVTLDTKATGKAISNNYFKHVGL